jgi:tungstate transport system substrate-binding protein
MMKRGRFAMIVIDGKPTAQCLAPEGCIAGRTVMEFARRSLLALALIGMATAPAPAQGPRTITVASTTSTEQSGLFGHLLPRFTQKTGIEVKVVALGTGQALDVGRRGDADVVFVHDKPAEEKFVTEGFAAQRREVMYNDFLILGPRGDPAKAAGKDVLEGLRRIADTRAPFISRGDRSGTHAAELRYWKEAGVDLGGRGDWYKEIGQGMGPALNAASAQNAYVLSDRGTWLSFRNKGELTVLVEGDQRLFNQYGVMLVNPARHPHVKEAEGQAFIDWLVSPEGQKAIADYKIGGEQLFFPNAGGLPRS